MKRSLDSAEQNAVSERPVARVRRPFVAPKMCKPSAAPEQPSQSAQTIKPLPIKPKVVPGQPNPNRAAKDIAHPAVSSTASAAMQYFTVLYTKRSNKASRYALDSSYTA